MKRPTINNNILSEMFKKIHKRKMQAMTQLKAV